MAEFPNHGEDSKQRIEQQHVNDSESLERTGTIGNIGTTSGTHNPIVVGSGAVFISYNLPFEGPEIARHGEDSKGVGKQEPVKDSAAPSQPEDVFIDKSKLTASTVTVTWRPGGEDGETEWFFVNYREFNTTSTFDTATRVRIPDGVYEHTVVGLRPYTVYEIEVYAENVDGPSEYIKRIVTTLPEHVSTGTEMCYMRCFNWCRKRLHFKKRD